MTSKKKHCDHHRLEYPIFTDPKLGGIIGWTCKCGILKEDYACQILQFWIKSKKQLLADANPSAPTK